MTFLVTCVAVLAAFPALMGIWNVLQLRRPAIAADIARLAILIPARNEEHTIRDCVASALNSFGVDVEVIVLDDGSTDGTADIVAKLANENTNLRLARAPALPAGWKGKTHACHVLSGMTDRPYMLFIDADVRLDRTGAARLIPRQGMDLISGVPRQDVGSLIETAVVPMINTLIYFYLPVFLSKRRKTDAALAAACGQLIMVRRSAYLAAGGHAAIAHAMHDGMRLARNFRAAGFATDMVDATELASCRMYASTKDLWLGFSKNATEGMAKPIALPIWTLLLGGGLVAPFAIAPFAWLRAGDWDASFLLISLLLLLIARYLQAVKCSEPMSAILLMPFGAMATLAIQWSALIGYWRGRHVVWRDRFYRPQI